MRVAIAGFLHESNTFNPVRTDRAAFEAQCFQLGPAFVEEWRDAHHEMGGFIEGAERYGYELLPLGMAWATPAGPVQDAVLEEVVSTIIDSLRRKHGDGLLLALHGAMVANSFPDADGEVLRRLRQAVGPDLPIVVTFDLHGNLTEQMVSNCNAAVTYRTNPHVDQRECGLRAASLMKRILGGEIRPCQALAKPPLIISLAVQDTSCEPLRPFFDELRRLEETQPILAASFALGFPYADVPQMGPSLLVVTDDDEDRARREADVLSRRLWDARERMTARLPDAAEAVALALRSAETPVVLVDFGDNIGGGSAGDGTVLLAEMLRQGATNGVVCLYAPAEVQECVRTGIHQSISLAVGGKVDRLHGVPVQVRGTVRALHDGTYVEPEPRHGGKRINHMGCTAVVEIVGHNLLVLTSLRHPPFSLGQLTCLGIRPEQHRLLVVKAAIAYKAAYLPIAGKIIEVDTPGLTAVNPARFTYHRIRRPLFPLDPHAEWS
jgi:microcystin degradation protein MlrC